MKNLKDLIIYCHKCGVLVEGKAYFHIIQGCQFLSLNCGEGNQTPTISVNNGEYLEKVGQS